MAGLQRKIARSPGRCIFCGNGKLTAEHFWPEWASSLLPNGRELSYYDFASKFDRTTGRVDVTKNYKRQGSVTTKRLRVVCAPCNNGWMSQLESGAKPILSPMAKGAKLAITPEMQEKLATWIALKVMVAEHNIIKEVVSDETVRHKFRNDRVVPEGFQIWILRCGAPRWRSRYHRYAAHLSVSSSPAESTDRKNTQGVTFGFGEALIAVLHTRVPGLTLDLRIAEPFGLKLWPLPGGHLEWPPTGLPAIAADDIAKAVERFVQSPAGKLE